MIYNYILCWLYSMTKSVVIALIYFLYFVGFYCNGFSIKLVKNQVWNEESVQFCLCLTRSLPAKRAHEKHMLEVEESCQVVNFANVSQERPTREQNIFPRRFLSVTFLPFTHTIYTLITHKCIRGHSERKTLDRFSTT